jgi:hypothetical protein
MRRGMLGCSMVLLAACGSEAPTPVPSAAPAADIVLTCQPSGFSAGAGCATSAAPWPRATAFPGR